MRNSRVRRHFTKSLAAFTTVAIVGAALGASTAQAATPPPAEKPLSVTLTATPSAPFIDGNSGTSVAAAITNMVGVTDQDVLYLGLLDERGKVTSRVTVVPGKANSSGDVTTGSATFTISKSGNLRYRLWVDQEDPITGTRNRTWDNSVELNEPTKTGTFAFAGNPAAVTLSDSAAKPLGSLVTVNEGTCKVFRAMVVDGAGTPVREQQLQITFEAGAVGNQPQPCLDSDLDSVSKSAATGTSPAGIISGRTDTTGAVSFALKGARGVPAWTGSVEVRVVDPKANASAVASFTMTTNPGGNNAVHTINPVAPAKVSRLSSTRVAVTALDRFGQPLQGVTLLANSVATPTTTVSLAATDMNGTTALTVDTSVLGLQTLNIWANKTGAGYTDGLDAGEKSVQVKIEVIPQVVDIARSTFTVEKSVVPVEAASNLLTLFINDENGFPVKDVQIDFAVTKGANVSLTSTSVTTDGNGRAVVTASRNASIKTRDPIEIRATVRNSNPVASIVARFEIQPRAASKIAVISPSQKVSTIDGGTTRVEVALQDQFGGPFVGTVSFRSAQGRNYSASGVQQVTTDATGHAVVNFADVKGRNVNEGDLIIAEALTVDNGTIGSEPVSVAYTPSLEANKMTQVGLPDSYKVLYENNASQSSFSVTLKVQNSTSSVDRDLLGLSAKVAISGPGVIGSGVTSVNSVTDNSANVTFVVHPSGVAGTITVSATVGATTKSWSVFVVPDAAGARNIAVSPSKAAAQAGGSVRFTAVVSDVFGNKLAGVWVTFRNSGVGRLNLVGLKPCTLGTSDSNLSDMALTDDSGRVWTDLLTASYDSGDAKVTGYIGWPFATDCVNYPETAQSAGVPFAAALAGNASATSTVAYTLDTSAADQLAAAQSAAAKAAADKAAADKAAAQAAADKAAAQALASQATADKAAAQALASQATADKVAAQVAADKAAADKVAAQVAADKAAADKAAADKVAAQAAADKAAAQALASQATADKAAADSTLSQIATLQSAFTKVLQDSKKSLLLASKKLKAAQVLYAKALLLAKNKR